MVPVHAPRPDVPCLSRPHRPPLEEPVDVLGGEAGVVDVAQVDNIGVPSVSKALQRVGAHLVAYLPGAWEPRAPVADHDESCRITDNADAGDFDERSLSLDSAERMGVDGGDPSDVSGLEHPERSPIRRARDPDRLGELVIEGPSPGFALEIDSMSSGLCSRTYCSVTACSRLSTGFSGRKAAGSSSAAGQEPRRSVAGGCCSASISASAAP